MGKLRKFFIVAIACVCLTPLWSQNMKALVGGTLIDGFSSTPIQNSVIIIKDDKIVKVGTVETLAIPAGAEIISTEGMSVMPGLWDMHVHLRINGHSDYGRWNSPDYLAILGDVVMPASAHQLLLAGVTSARDLGGNLEESIRIRDRINNGELPGPTMYMSGAFIQKRVPENSKVLSLGN